MQLGARWRVGEPPHRSVPEQLHALIGEAEALHPDADSWTLTWLEGRPRCALDGLLIVTPQGILDLKTSDTADHLGGDAGYDLGEDSDDDDWLS